jgi:hypothetical protein
MSFYGEHHGFIEPHRTAHTWHIFSPMAIHWVPMMMTTPSVGMTSELGPKFYFPRSYSKTQLLELLHYLQGLKKIPLLELSTGFPRENYSRISDIQSTLGQLHMLSNSRDI